MTVGRAATPGPLNRAGFPKPCGASRRAFFRAERVPCHLQVQVQVQVQVRTKLPGCAYQPSDDIPQGQDLRDVTDRIPPEDAAGFGVANAGGERSRQVPVVTVDNLREAISPSLHEVLCLDTQMRPDAGGCISLLIADE